MSDTLVPAVQASTKLPANLQLVNTNNVGIDYFHPKLR